LHVLVTADTISGSWTYARELVTDWSRAAFRRQPSSPSAKSLCPIKLPGWIISTASNYRPRFPPGVDGRSPATTSPNPPRFSPAWCAKFIPTCFSPPSSCHGNLPVDVPFRVNHWPTATSSALVASRARCAPRARAGSSGIADTTFRASPPPMPSSRPRWHAQHCYRHVLPSAPRQHHYPGRNPIFFNPYVSKDDFRPLRRPPGRWPASKSFPAHPALAPVPRLDLHHVR